MQVELLVWLGAGIGLGLFIAMAVLAIFAASERRHLRRWRQVRSPAVLPAPADVLAVPATAPAEPEEVQLQPPAVSAASPSATTAREAGASAEPVPGAERSQLDVEGLFEEAFQSSLTSDRQPGQKRS